MRLLIAVAMLAAACSPSATGPAVCAALPPAEGGAGSLLADPSLALASWDSGPIVDRCHAEAPWGSTSWGVEAASFLDENGEGGRQRAIDWARVSVHGGAARVAAGDVRGRWAFARIIQGDMWGGTSCGAVPWNGLEPIPVAQSRLALDFDVCLEGSRLGSAVGSWVLAGANVWLSSPTMPASGLDRHARKPLVLDLMVHHRTSMLGTSDGSHENDLAYHDQTSVAQALAGRWTHVSVDLTQKMRAATAAFGLDAVWDDLAIHQVDLVVEVHDATAAVHFARPWLRKVGGAVTVSR